MRRPWTRASLACTLAWLMVSWIGSASTSAQAPRKTIWDGIYSAAQAARGNTAYGKHCAGCHGNELKGLNANGPALVGPRFIETWEGNLFALFDRMRSPMPLAEDVTVPDPEVLDMLAFILQA